MEAIRSKPAEAGHPPWGVIPILTVRAEAMPKFKWQSNERGVIYIENIHHEISFNWASCTCQSNDWWSIKKWEERGRERERERERESVCVCGLNLPRPISPLGVFISSAEPMRKLSPSNNQMLNMHQSIRLVSGLVSFSLKPDRGSFPRSKNGGKFVSPRTVLIPTQNHQFWNSKSPLHCSAFNHATSGRRSLQ